MLLLYLPLNLLRNAETTPTRFPTEAAKLLVVNKMPENTTKSD